MSDSWLVGKNTGRNRILNAVGRSMAEKIDSAVRSGQAVKLLIRTDKHGLVSVGALDKAGKVIENSEQILKSFGREI